MKLALVSLNQHWLNKEKNFIQCCSYAQQASQLGCDLIVFPEMTLTGFAPEVKEIHEREEQSESLEMFSELAEQHNISILFGVSVILKGNVKPSNVVCYAEPNKHVKTIYSKNHLFAHANEDQYFAEGTEQVIFTVADIKFGLAICYDLRFPDLFFAMSAECDAFLVIASWPKERVDDWRALLKARAIENRTMAIGANRTGCDGNGLEYVESTCIYLSSGVDLKPISCSEDMKLFVI